MARFGGELQGEGLFTAVFSPPLLDRCPGRACRSPTRGRQALLPALCSCSSLEVRKIETEAVRPSNPIRRPGGSD